MWSMKKLDYNTNIHNTSSLEPRNGKIEQYVRCWKDLHRLLQILNKQHIKNKGNLHCPAGKFFIIVFFSNICCSFWVAKTAIIANGPIVKFNPRNCYICLSSSAHSLVSFWFQHYYYYYYMTYRKSHNKKNEKNYKTYLTSLWDCKKAKCCMTAQENVVLSSVLFSSPLQTTPPLMILWSTS